jgi:hypothetical protein
MKTWPQTYLTTFERYKSDDIPKDINEREVIHYFTLSDDEICRAKQRRGVHNILGFAYQIGSLKMLGKFPENPRNAPRQVISYLSKQLDIHSVLFLDYPQRETTKWEHAAEIRDFLGYKRFNTKDEKDLRKFLFDSAMYEQNTMVLMHMGLNWCIKEKVIRPGISIIERLVGWAKNAADEDIFQNLSQQISEDQKARWNNLLNVTPETKTSPLQRIKQAPPYPSVKAFQNFMTIRSDVEELLSPSLDFSEIPSNKIMTFSKLTHKYHVWFLSRFNEQKRMAFIACYLKQRFEELTDLTIDMFIRLSSQIFQRSNNDQKENKHKVFESLRNNLDILRHPARIIMDSNVNDLELRNEIFSIIPKENLEKTLQIVDQLFQTLEMFEKKPLDNRYSFLRQFFPSALSTFKFHSQKKVTL